MTVGCRRFGASTVGQELAAVADIFTFYLLVKLASNFHIEKLFLCLPASSAWKKRLTGASNEATCGDMVVLPFWRSLARTFFNSCQEAQRSEPGPLCKKTAPFKPTAFIETNVFSQ
jgi:hypothetical protein